MAVLGAVPAANAAPLADAPASVQTSTTAVEEQIDPAAYEGELIVATDQGDVVVSVEAGEGTLFTNRPDGSLDSLSTEAAQIVEDTGVSIADAETGQLNQADIGVLAACGVWLNTIAGPGVYWESVDGCAVAGYPGYQREYKWENLSDMLICVCKRAAGIRHSPGMGWGAATPAAPSWSQGETHSRTPR